ncbi:hypothetical protein ASPZODRAFT_144771 [Penicilliopsis zonata CBS 506.65]|uniref:REJ domain-containing protein n=1 Tax=Penicilliopsis zonata CBS 506.65 TaxID=1073090 RepID=A0A1L9SCC0_9EURO|nr:hypothetical protein ASPZODRAFT_144771 [Penicilliopsis zonata CBS 506.65]OJJ44826.1 hypothetical protein ASPZODRAFT_144771 [Penicilliopsis zonata CBS 506.65]
MATVNSSVPAAQTSSSTTSYTSQPETSTSDSSTSSTSTTTSSLPPTTSTSTTSSTTSSTSSTSSTTTSTTTSIYSNTEEAPTTAAALPTTTASESVETTVVSDSGSVTTIVITSTASLAANPTVGSSSTSTTSSSGTAASHTSGAGSSGGLSAGGTIAVAVVVPVVGVALIILAALWFWRKRKANKLAEEERRKEAEEYGFNPNNDPTLPGVGVAGAYGQGYEPKEDQSGYRGWGTTSAGRKASTNLSSTPGVGMAMSDNGSAPGYHHAASPSDGTIQYSEGQGRPISGESESIGVLGAAPVSANNRNPDIRRGPSNASSAYSAGNHSEASDDSRISGGHPGANIYDENPYYGDVQQPYGSYGEGPYGSGQPVIRDVQARRNTRIENPAVFPKQGNAGIAQNF